MRILSWTTCILALLAVCGGTAHAKPEDLKRQIEVQQAGIADLERLDDRRAVPDEIVLLKTWLDEAWGQYAKEEYDRVREVLERAIAQAELIREKISSTRLQAVAA